MAMERSMDEAGGGGPMIDEGVERALLQAVDALEAEAVDVLAGLVRHRSLLGEEAECLDAMEDHFAALGLEPWRVPTDPEALAGVAGFSPPLISYEGRDNVVAVHRPLAVSAGACCCRGMWTWCRRGPRTSGPRRRSSRRCGAGGCTGGGLPT